MCWGLEFWCRRMVVCGCLCCDGVVMVVLVRSMGVVVGGLWVVGVVVEFCVRAVCGLLGEGVVGEGLVGSIWGVCCGVGWWE